MFVDLSLMPDVTAALKASYSRFLEPVCEKYRLTRMELLILLFLANNPQFNSPADIVKRRKLVKSHVSTSVKSLESRGWLSKTCDQQDKRALRLKILEPALPAIQEGQQAQKDFQAMVFKGCDPAQLEMFLQVLLQIHGNMESFLQP